MLDFQDFLKLVPKFSAVSLPAKEAHFKMAPPERIQFLENLDQESFNPKNAAVLMLVYPKGDKAHLAFIVRNAYDGTHSSQIAFPGGKYELSDINFEATAIRETHEEIGVHPDKIKIIKAFTHLYIPPSNFMVYPYLGFCSAEIEFILDPKEVAGIIEISLLEIVNDDLIVNTNIQTSYAEKIFTPAFLINDHLVWGATAMMLSELKEVLKKVL